jgi:YVTN family beta-propeller protein
MKARSLEDRTAGAPDTPHAGNLPAAIVLNTLELANRTTVPGNVVPENGSYPEDLALDANDSRLFISTGGGLIVVVNTSSDRLIDTIPVPYGAWGIAYDSQNNEVYAARGYAGNNVTVIDASNDSIVGTIGVGREPIGVTADPSNGKVYVMNIGSGNVSVIDSSTNTVVGTIGVGSGPYFGALDTKNGDLFVTNDYSDNVSIIDTASGLVVGTAPVGVAPVGIVYDPANGNMYVSDYTPSSGNTPGSVTVLSGSTGAYVTSITVGTCPWGAAYDSAMNEVYVTDSTCTTFGNVTVINATTNRVVTTIWLGWPTYPDAIVFDSSNGLLYAANYAAANVSIINGSAHKVVGTVGAGEEPTDLAYDSSSGLVYVADSGGNDVAVVSGSTGMEVGDIGSWYGPDGLAYDPANRNLYVANYFSDNVSVINTTTDRTVASIPVGSYPEGVGYDPANQDIYVANCHSGNVSVIQGSSDMVSATVVAGICPNQVTFDPSNGDLYVTNLGPNIEINGLPGNVTVINGTSNRAVASVGTGTGPWGSAYDPATGLLYVACYITGNLTVINGSTQKTAGSIHVGLYPTEPAYDSLDDEIFAATGRAGNLSDSNEVVAVQAATGSLLGEASVGTSPWGDVFDESTNSMLTTNWFSGTVSLLRPTIYPPPRLPVSFTEEGLAGGTAWSVTLNGTANTSSTSAIGFSETNGHYSYTVPPVAGYLLLSPANGSFTVHFQNVSILLRFVAVYPVNFTESGLANGASWSVIWNGSTLRISGSSFTVSATNGSYSFFVTGPLDYFPSPSSGIAVVKGTNVTEQIAFAWTPPPNILSFRIIPSSGPVGTRFALSVSTSGGSGPLLYAYVGLPGNCSSRNLSELTCTPQAPGNTTVEVIVADSLGRSSTANATIRVTVTPVAPPQGTTGIPKFLGLPWEEGVALLVGLVAFLGLAAVVFLWRWRAKARPKPTGSSQEGKERSEG